MGDVPFEDELETLVGNQFFPKHVAFFNCPSNTTFYSNSQAKLDEFRVFLETNGNSRIRPIRENKAEQLGLSKSEVAQILIEAQAARDFDRR